MIKVNGRAGGGSGQQGAGEQAVGWKAGDRVPSLPISSWVFSGNLLSSDKSVPSLVNEGFVDLGDQIHQNCLLFKNSS